VLYLALVALYSTGLSIQRLSVNYAPQQTPNREKHQKHRDHRPSVARLRPKRGHWVSVGIARSFSD
jgi:hypothetical protein